MASDATVHPSLDSELERLFIQAVGGWVMDNDERSFFSMWYQIQHNLREREVPGIDEWRIRFINSGGGLCLHDGKELWIDTGEIHNPAMLLHEVAHINHPKHSVYWGDFYTELVRRFCDWQS